MNKTYFIIFLTFLIGCNFSDESVELPGGSTYVNEGKCNKLILVNIKNSKNIESCVSEYKFDDSFITACQIDEKACENDSIEIKNKLFFIIDVKKEVLYGPLSKNIFLEKLSALKADTKLIIE